MLCKKKITRERLALTSQNYDELLKELLHILLSEV